jgi:hypothetical protein
MKKITMEMYLDEPNRYELRSGSEADAPLCPYGNHYEWIGFDRLEKEYVRFTKSVFKRLMRETNR